MAEPRRDVIFGMNALNSYPGSEWLDVTFFLPRVEPSERRLWVQAPRDAPTVAIEDAVFSPQRVCEGPPRWVDYGVAQVRTGFSQLRVGEMSPAAAAESHVVVTTRTDLSLEGCELAEVERMLWGLARCEAGSTTLTPARVTAGAPARLVVRYAAGPEGLPAGAQVRFAVPKVLRAPQTEDPRAAGFVSVRAPEQAVSVVSIADSAESHEARDIVCRLEKPFGAGEAFELSYDTDRMYIYSGAFTEADRRYWYSHLPPLAAAVAISDEGQFVPLADANSHSFEVVPGPPTRLHLFLPGRRKAGQELRLRGLFTDRYRNSPGLGAVNTDLELSLVHGDTALALGSPAGAFTERNRFETRLPDLPAGVYRALARDRGTGEVVATSNPLEVMEDGDDRPCLYWGEIHGHTEMSDGAGGYRDLYRHAREEGCLDFAAAADHACYFSDNEWEWMQDITNSCHDPGCLATLIGYEWSGKQVHRNIYTSRSRLQLFRGLHRGSNELGVVWQHFHGDEEVVGGPHAPRYHGVTWESHDPSVERFVEIYSMWGASDSFDGPLVPPWAGKGERQATVDELLQTGAKLGFTGGGDCHEGRVGFSHEDPCGQGTTSHTWAPLLFRCGMTAALMPGLDRGPLIRALRERRTYATTGARILLDFTVSGFAMGGIGEADRATCRGSVHAVREVEAIEIIKDGTVAWRSDCHGLDADLRWDDPEPVAGEQYYYLRVIQKDGEMAWSSPVWVRSSAGS